MKNRTKHPLYITYTKMKERCYNENSPSYKNYGGRGIKVCKAWLKPKTGFPCFVKAMGEKPTPKHSIDRINNDGNYNAKNCRWATSSEQLSNRRNYFHKRSGLNLELYNQTKRYLRLPNITLRQISMSTGLNIITIHHIKSGRRHKKR